MMAAASRQRPSFDASVPLSRPAGEQDLPGRGITQGLRYAAASLVSTRFSLISGGLACVGAVALVCGLLPGFVRYKSEPA
jgi:hypothetical protein